MPTTTAWLLDKYPSVYHVTYTSNLPGIRLNGFRSANALKRLARSASGFRAESAPLFRKGLGYATLRDQGRMPPKSLRECLPINLSTDDWYQLVDDHIFFFFDEQKAEELFEKYIKLAPQSLLAAQTRDVLSAVGPSVRLTPINTGAVGRARAKRDADTFHPLDKWIREGFTDRIRTRPKAPVELAVRLDSLRIDFSVRDSRP
jgi:hypothetical protein